MVEVGEQSRLSLPSSVVGAYPMVEVGEQSRSSSSSVMGAVL